MTAVLPFAAFALSAFSAYGQYKAGKAQAKGLARQATMDTIAARGKALEARAQGLEALKAINRTNAALNARSAAGGIDPFSGSAAGLAMYNVSEGAREYFISQDNQIILREGGEIGAQNLLAQAASAKQAGLYQAAGTLGAASMNLYQTMKPSKATA